MDHEHTMVVKSLTFRNSSATITKTCTSKNTTELTTQDLTNTLYTNADCQHHTETHSLNPRITENIDRETAKKLFTKLEKLPTLSLTDITTNELYICTDSISITVIYTPTRVDQIHAYVFHNGTEYQITYSKQNPPVTY